MFFKMIKKNNLLFLEKEVREGLLTFIKELILNRERSYGYVEDINFLSSELRNAIIKSGLSAEQMNILIFNIIENSTKNFHLDNTVMIKSRIKCFRIENFYFTITKVILPNGISNTTFSLTGMKPLYYTSVLTYDKEKNKKGKK